MVGWHHKHANWTPKPCASCGLTFTPKSGSHKFCSKSCKRYYSRQFGCEKTEYQYKLISGNWSKYFARLCNNKQRSQLTKKDCMLLFEKQHGRCALSGVELTCVLIKGTVTNTNASIDRIDPKGPYTIDNIQLVCVAVNKFRVDTSLEEFVDWCRKVVNHAIQK